MVSTDARLGVQFAIERSIMALMLGWRVDAFASCLFRAILWPQTTFPSWFVDLSCCVWVESEG